MQHNNGISKNNKLIRWYNKSTIYKFRATNWVEINDESRRTYDYNSDIKFKTSMIMSNLCDYSDAYIRAKLTITVPNTATQGATVSNTNNKVIFK